MKTELSLIKKTAEGFEMWRVEAELVKGPNIELGVPPDCEYLILRSLHEPPEEWRTVTEGTQALRKLLGDAR